MTIVGLLLVIFLLGFIVYATYRWAPIPPGFKTAIYFVCMAIVILIILSAFGILPDMNERVPHLR